MVDYESYRLEQEAAAQDRLCESLYRAALSTQDAAQKEDLLAKSRQAGNLAAFLRQRVREVEALRPKLLFGDRDAAWRARCRD